MSHPPGSLKAGDLLTTAEAAGLLRVTPRTVERWELAGKIAASRLPGGQRRFKRADVEALLELGLAKRPAPADPNQLAVDLTDANPAAANNATPSSTPQRRKTDHPVGKAS